MIIRRALSRSAATLLWMSNECLRHSMSLTLARFMWRSNLSFGTNFLRLDFMMLFVNVLIKIFAILYFTIRGYACLNSAPLRFA